MAKKGKRTRKRARKKKLKKEYKELKKISSAYGHMREDDDEGENI